MLKSSDSSSSRRADDNPGNKEIVTKPFLTGHDKISSDIVDKGKELITKVPTLFNSCSDHKRLWHNINLETNHRSLEGGAMSTEASRVLQRLEDSIRDGVDIKSYCQEIDTQVIFKRNKKLQESLERIVEKTSGTDEATRDVEEFKNILKGPNGLKHRDVSAMLDGSSIPKSVKEPSRVLSYFLKDQIKEAKHRAKIGERDISDSKPLVALAEILNREEYSDAISLKNFASNAVKALEDNGIDKEKFLNEFLPDDLKKERAKREAEKPEREARRAKREAEKPEREARKNEIETSMLQFTSTLDFKKQV